MPAMHHSQKAVRQANRRCPRSPARALSASATQATSGGSSLAGGPSGGPPTECWESTRATPVDKHQCATRGQRTGLTNAHSHWDTVSGAQSQGHSDRGKVQGRSHRDKVSACGCMWLASSLAQRWKGRKILLPPPPVPLRRHGHTQLTLIATLGKVLIREIHRGWLVGCGGGGGVAHLRPRKGVPGAWDPWPGWALARATVVHQAQQDQGQGQPQEHTPTQEHPLHEGEPPGVPGGQGRARG